MRSRCFLTTGGSFTRSEASGEGFLAFFSMQKVFVREKPRIFRNVFWGGKLVFLINTRQSFGAEHFRFRLLLSLFRNSPYRCRRPPGFLDCPKKQENVYLKRFKPFFFLFFSRPGPPGKKNGRGTIGALLQYPFILRRIILILWLYRTAPPTAFNART